jgi:hypothetical protein
MAASIAGYVGAASLKGSPAMSFLCQESSCLLLAGQVAYALTLLLAYGKHFVPELLDWSTSQTASRLPRTSSEKAAAVLDYSLTAEAPDDPPMPIQGPIIEEFGQGALLAGACRSSAGGSREDLERERATEAEANADEWELLSSGAGSSGAEVGMLASSSASGEDDLVAAPDGQPLVVAAASAQAEGSGEGAEQGLRRRHAGLSVLSQQAVPAGLPGHAPGNETDARGGPVTRGDIIRTSGMFTLQAWLPMPTTRASISHHWHADSCQWCTILIVSVRLSGLLARRVCLCFLVTQQCNNACAGCGEASAGRGLQDGDGGI